jgi:hypothetical protein
MSIRLPPQKEKSLTENNLLSRTNKQIIRGATLHSWKSMPFAGYSHIPGN